MKNTKNTKTMIQIYIFFISPLSPVYYFFLSKSFKLSIPIWIMMLCLRLKLLQITNLHIRIKLCNGNSIKTIHIALVITFKIPFHKQYAGL